MKTTMVVPVYTFGLIAFVKHPHLHGLYIKTHVCVVVVDCPYESCKSKAGMPCRNHRGDYCSFTHAARRNLLKLKGGKCQESV